MGVLPTVDAGRKAHGVAFADGAQGADVLIRNIRAHGVRPAILSRYGGQRQAEQRSPLVFRTKKRLIKRLGPPWHEHAPRQWPIVGVMQQVTPCLGRLDRESCSKAVGGHHVHEDAYIRSASLSDRS